MCYSSSASGKLRSDAFDVGLNVLKKHFPPDCIVGDYYGDYYGFYI